MNLGTPALAALRCPFGAVLPMMPYEKPTKLKAYALSAVHSPKAVSGAPLEAVETRMAAHHLIEARATTARPAVRQGTPPRVDDRRDARSCPWAAAGTCTPAHSRREPERRRRRRRRTGRAGTRALGFTNFGNQQSTSGSSANLLRLPAE